MSKEALSGGERILLKDSGGTPREQSSPPTPQWPDVIGSGDFKKALSGGDSMLRPKGEKVDSVVATHSPSAQLREIAEKYFWHNTLPSFNSTNCVELHNEQVLRAMQEAWEIGYKCACEADNAQFKYGYKKGLADGDDTHAL